MKLLSEKELAGLTAEIMALAGLLLVVKAIGVLELRMLERVGGMRPRVLRRGCLTPILLASSVSERLRTIEGVASWSEL